MAHIYIKEVEPTLFKIMLKTDEINTVINTIIYQKMPT